MTSPNRVSAAFLDIRTPGGVIMRRWQSRWLHTAVTWEGAEWGYAPLEWSGVSSGGLIDAATAALSLPLLLSLEQDLRTASDGYWIGRLRVYHYAEPDDGPQPPAGMVLVGGPFRGRVVLAGVSDSRLEVTLDAGLIAAGGSRFPPRQTTTALIGTPCELGGGR